MQRWLLLRLALWLLGVFAATWISVRYDEKLTAAVLAIVASLASWAPFSPKVRRWWLGEVNRSNPEQLKEAAMALRHAIGKQWSSESTRRDERFPVDQMAVRWELVTDSVRKTNLADKFPRNGPIVALLEAYVATPMRMIVTGDTGSGKTALCVRLILELLQKEQAERIPVMFPLSSWKPGEDFRKWLIRKLNEEYRFLSNLQYGGTAAEDLLEQDRLLLILDGLDELIEQNRVTVLQAIEGNSIFFSAFVLTCSTEKFEEAIDRRIIRESLRIALLPMHRAAAASYLREHFSSKDLDRWQPVLDELSENPDGPLTTTLTNPLMLFLVWATYKGRTTPSELLDRERFDTSELIKSYLLNSFIPKAFTPPIERSKEHNSIRPAKEWAPDKAQTYLTFLAKYLNSLRPPGDRAATDLSWWQLYKKVPRYVFVLTPAVLGTVGCCLLGWLIFGLFGRPPIFGILFGLPFGLLIGLALGWLSPEPPRQFVPRVLTKGEFRLKRRLLQDLGFGLVGALGGGVTIWLLYGATYGVASGLIFGLIFSMVRRFTQATEPKSAANPMSVLKSDRAAVIYGWLLGALVGTAFGGFLGATGSEIAHHLIFNLTPIQRVFLGAAVGMIVGGATLGMMVQATSAWGHFITARVWLALTGSTPLRLMLFLDDALKLGVLRCSGPHYQFRHPLLQDCLANRKQLAAVDPEVRV